MDKPSYGIHDLDALIEEALREEPFLHAPSSLHRGVEARLAMAALRDREQMRFRWSMAVLVLSFCAVLLTAGGLVWFTHLGLLYQDGVSGGRGQMDYYTTSVVMTWTSYQGGYSLVVSLALAAGAVLLALLRPLDRRLWTP